MELSWGQDLTSADQLAATGHRELRVTGVPDARMAPVAQALRDLEAAQQGDLIPALGERDDAEVTELEEFHRVAERLGLRASVCWSATVADALDVTLTARRPGEPGPQSSPPQSLQSAQSPASTGAPLASLVNAPATTRDTGALLSSIRAFLRDRLPEYLLPAATVVLETLPLTPNGKVDRRRLPEPDTGSTPGGRAPRDPMERLLCELFGDILGVSQVTIDDSFFALGGHSLSATRLSARLRAVLGLELPVRSVFEAPTVAALAEAVHLASAGERPALVAGKRSEPLPLSFAQRRLWFLDQLHTQGAAYHVPLVLDLTGELDRAALEAALADLVARHESLRTVFPATAGVPRQQVLDSVAARLPLEAGEVAAEELTEAVAAAVRRPFDLAHDLPVRASLLRTAPDRHVLVLVIHHIACDGWSLAPLWRDLAAAYTARRAAGRRRSSRCPSSTPTTACGSSGCWARRTIRRA